MSDINFTTWPKKFAVLPTPIDICTVGTDAY